jgi:hypothetical protein
MLFLLNDRVLDLGAPGETLQRLAGEQALQRLSGLKSLAETKHCVFQAGGADRLKDDERLRLSCLLAITTEANAAVFVVLPGASSAAQVASRLAKVGLTTLAWLDEMQNGGKLTPALINANVWAQAAA